VKRYIENGVLRRDLERGQIDLLKRYEEERYLWNIDIHPTPIENRTWGL